jgi:hypothetical protein
MTAGYSGTPLAGKLGIKDGMRVRTFGAPDGFSTWLDPLPTGVVVSSRIRSADLGVVFVTTVSAMVRAVDVVLPILPNDGAIWVCWPKKASGVVSELQRRETMVPELFARGLVDVKVAAISDVWSGLKFVTRVELR